jgi:hypothetical protein
MRASCIGELVQQAGPVNLSVVSNAPGRPDGPFHTVNRTFRRCSKIIRVYGAGTDGGLYFPAEARPSAKLLPQPVANQDFDLLASFN